MTTTLDERVTQAREFLDGARRRKVAELPPSLLIRECAELRRQLGQVLGAVDRADEDEDGTEAHCTVCGQWAGMFLGMDGWHHFRGDPAPGGKRELYDAGHAPVIGWARPVLLAPAELGTVLDGLAVAAEYRRYRASLTCQACAEHPAELCEDHQADLDAAEAYEDLAARIGGAR